MKKIIKLVWQGGNIPRGPVPGMAPQPYQGYNYPNNMAPQNGGQQGNVIYSSMQAGEQS